MDSMTNDSFPTAIPMKSKDHRRRSDIYDKEDTGKGQTHRRS